MQIPAAEWGDFHIMLFKYLSFVQINGNVCRSQER
jgi:hypothetical protein